MERSLQRRVLSIEQGRVQSVCYHIAKGLYIMSTEPAFRSVPMLLVSSAVYMIAAAINCNKSSCTNLDAYAVSVGVISTVVTGIMVGLRSMNRGSLLDKFDEYISVVLLLWWGFGAGIGTFDSPFEAVGNGYFAGWASFLFATKYAYETNTQVRGVIDKGAGAIAAPRDASDNTWNAGAGGGATSTSV